MGNAVWAVAGRRERVLIVFGWQAPPQRSSLNAGGVSIEGNSSSFASLGQKVGATFQAEMKRAAQGREKGNPDECTA